MVTSIEAPIKKTSQATAGVEKALQPGRPVHAAGLPAPATPQRGRGRPSGVQGQLLPAHLLPRHLLPKPVLPQSSHAADGPTADAVYAALWANDLLRSLEYGHITVTIAGSKAVLRGHVTAAHTRQWVEQITRQVPGVEAVENHLVDDDTLVSQVCLALAEDPRTAHEIILVAARHGVIFLSGTVMSAAVRDAAEERAASVLQVRGVSNFIETPGVSPQGPETEQILQPCIGEEVIATDMALGRVAYVIISPHNRRVTGLVAYGEFPNPASHEHQNGFDRYDVTALDQPVTPQYRSVVIPRQAIAEITKTAVWLHVSGAEAARYRDFDPACFCRPREGWQPPYPYDAGDVWLALHGRHS